MLSPAPLKVIADTGVETIVGALNNIYQPVIRVGGGLNVVFCHGGGICCAR